MARTGSPRRLLGLMMALVVLASCGDDASSSDGGEDAATDSAIDAHREDDASIDAGIDAALDSGTLPLTDAGIDAGLDAGVDSGLDAALDAGVDAGFDAGFDAGPIDGGCTEGTTLPCSVDAGTCSAGLITCSAGDYGACVPDVVPTNELCNGLDEDCDGVPDDDFANLGETCDGSDSDLCATGAWVCASDGSAAECTDDLASVSELCNGFDDDCDGAIDDGYDVGAPCDGADADLCSDGVRVCSLDGTTWECSDEASSFVELCNGLDDDCDGAADEDFPTLGEACDGADTDLCATGTRVCATDGLSVVCNDDASSVEDLCNGLDDDCDGAADEDFPTLGEPCDGADADLCATGTRVCAADGLSVICNDDAATAVETCNQLDDDCDLAVDEGLHGMWTTQPIDTTTHPFEMPAIAIAPDGTRHVVYNDPSPGYGDLRHAAAPRTGSFVVGYVDAVGDTGRYPSLAIDSAGRLHAAYYDQSTKLRYATKTGLSAWAASTVDTASCWSTALAVDSADRIHLGCYWWFVGGGVVSWRTHDAASTTFGSPEAPDSTGNSDDGIGLAIDSGDLPHMTYYDDVSTSLRHAVRTGPGGTWAIEDIETAGDVGRNSRLAIDSADGLHVVYYDATNGDLRYAHRPAGQSFSSTAIETTGDVGLYSSVAISPDGEVHILYASASGLLRRAHGMPGSGFTIEDVGASRVSFVDVEADAVGGLHVAYRASMPDSLQYAHRCP